MREERKPNKYNIFHYQGKECQLPLEKVAYPGKVELRIMPDNQIKVFRGKELTQYQQDILALKLLGHSYILLTLFYFIMNKVK